MQYIEDSVMFAVVISGFVAIIYLAELSITSGYLEAIRSMHL